MVRVIDARTKEVQVCKRPGDVKAALANVLKTRKDQA